MPTTIVENLRLGSTLIKDSKLAGPSRPIDELVMPPFASTFAKERNSKSGATTQSSPVQHEHFPPLDLSDMSPENVARVFELGFAAASRDAAAQGVELRFEPSGQLAKAFSLTDVNPIEYQNILARFPGSEEWVQIGQVLPEANHLQTVKSPEQVRAAVNGLVARAVEQHSPSTLPAEDLRDFSPENAQAIFERAFEQAEEYAKEQRLQIFHQGSGNHAKGLEFSAIELRNIYIREEGTSRWIKIGTLLPERDEDHLGTLKSSAELTTELKRLIDSYR